MRSSGGFVNSASFANLPVFVGRRGSRKNSKRRALLLRLRQGYLTSVQRLNVPFRITAVARTSDKSLEHQAEFELSSS